MFNFNVHVDRIWLHCSGSFRVVPDFSTSRPRVNSLVCDRAAAFCAAGPPEALFWMSRLVTQAAKHERELARAHSQRLKQATLSLPGESVSRGFADRGALEGYPSHYTSLVLMFVYINKGFKLSWQYAETRVFLCFNLIGHWENICGFYLITSNT